MDSLDSPVRYWDQRSTENLISSDAPVRWSSRSRAWTSWSVKEALAVADAVRPYDLSWFEEPIWPPEDFESLAQVRAQSGLKIAAGENAMSVKNFEQMFKADDPTLPLLRSGAVGQHSHRGNACSRTDD